MACEVVRVPESLTSPAATVIVCSRGGRRPGCEAGKPASEDRAGVWRCTGCGRAVDAYETADGRMLVLRHQ